MRAGRTLAHERLKLRSVRYHREVDSHPKDVIQNRNDVFHSPPYRDIP